MSLTQAVVSQDASAALADIAEEVRRHGFAFRPGKAMRVILGDPSLEAWSSLASSWEHLAVDPYMGDGGRYRRRRFAVFGVHGQTTSRKPHQPHYQSLAYNPLNGGIERWFEPVTAAVERDHLLQSVLRLCADIFDRLAPGRKLPWHVEMHQFRIEAVADQAGRPTPEGIHRDGVDWVGVMLINRHNAASGVTQIYDNDDRLLGEFTLSDPMDTVFIDDARIKHGVTPIHPLDPRFAAFRDVLVLTFRANDRTRS